MRIGLVVRGGVDRSGRERVVPALLWLIERLARDHTVHVFVLDYYDEPCTYPLLGATIHDVGRVTGPPGLRLLRLTRRLAKAVRVHGPLDVLHGYLGMPAGVIATRVGRALDIPVVVTLSSGELVRVDDIAYGLQRRWQDRRAIRRMLSDATVVTVPTEFMKRLATAHGVQPEIIPDGIQLEAFPFCERVNGPPWRIVRVGSINRVKDYATLLHVVAILPDTVSLDIVGEDTLGGEIQALAERLHIKERVRFHGWQPTDALAGFYARAHLNVVSSVHEASSVTMLEAASTGLPTVGTAVGYVADWHPHGALAVPVRDAASLANAIYSVLLDVRLQRELSATARIWTIEHDAGWSARAFGQVYQRLTKR